MTSDELGDLIYEVYRPEGAAIWLASPNPLLGGERPIDLIAEDRGDEVLAVLDALRGGAAL